MKLNKIIEKFELEIKKKNARSSIVIIVEFVVVEKQFVGLAFTVRLGLSNRP